MATRRSTIEVQVLNLDQLRSLNTSLNTYEKHIKNIALLNAQAGGSVNQFAQTFSRANTAVQQHNRSLSETQRHLKNAKQEADRGYDSFGRMFGVMVKYRAIDTIFQGIETAV